RVRDHRPVAPRPRRLLQRLRQPLAVAAAALPHGPGGLQPRDLRGLSPGQCAVRREAGADAARRRPGLGARLPPDPAGGAAARARRALPARLLPARSDALVRPADRKSTRLNSSHVKISYAVFCLKKKNESQEKLWHSL